MRVISLALLGLSLAAPACDKDPNDAPEPDPSTTGTGGANEDEAGEAGEAGEGTTGPGGSDMIPLKSGQMVFPNQGKGNLQVFDPFERSVVLEIEIPEAWCELGSRRMLFTALVRLEDRSIFVNCIDDEGEASVLEIDTLAGFFFIVSSGEDFVQQMAFDPLDPEQDTILAGAPFSNDVMALNPFHETTASRITIEEGNIIGLVVSGEDLLVGDHHSGDIAWYSASGTFLSGYADIGQLTGSDEINGMTFDDEGNLYVAQNSSQRIVKIPSDGQPHSSIQLPEFDRPHTVSFNPNDGLLYVGNSENGELVIMDRDGQLVDTVDLGGKFLGQAGLVP